MRGLRGAESVPPRVFSISPGFGIPLPVLSFLWRNPNKTKNKTNKQKNKLPEYSIENKSDKMFGEQAWGGKNWK